MTIIKLFGKPISAENINVADKSYFSLDQAPFPQSQTARIQANAVQICVENAGGLTAQDLGN